MQIANVHCFKLEFANVVFSGIHQCFTPPMFPAIDSNKQLLDCTEGPATINFRRRDSDHAEPWLDSFIPD